MTTQVQISDVQLINLTLLLAIHSSANKDPISACYKFNLRTEDISRIKDLGLEQIQAIVANVDQCLFCLRPEILDIFRTPPNLAGVLAAVRRTDNTTVGKPHTFPSISVKAPLHCEAA